MATSFHRGPANFQSVTGHLQNLKIDTATVGLIQGSLPQTPHGLIENVKLTWPKKYIVDETATVMFAKQPFQSFNC